MKENKDFAVSVLFFAMYSKKDLNNTTDPVTHDGKIQQECEKAKRPVPKLKSELLLPQRHISYTNCIQSRKNMNSVNG